VGATLRVVRVSKRTPRRASSSRMVWLSDDCDMPSFAAAFVKLRSRPTARNATIRIIAPVRRAAHAKSSWTVVTVVELPTKRSLAMDSQMGVSAALTRRRLLCVTGGMGLLATSGPGLAQITATADGTERRNDAYRGPGIAQRQERRLDGEGQRRAS
jgi:hypothetical protein